jgi:hypothetical protein
MQWTAPTAVDIAVAVRDEAVRAEHAQNPQASVAAINRVVPAGHTAIVDPANSAALTAGRSPDIPGHGVVIVADGVQARQSELANLERPVAMAQQGHGGTWAAVTDTPAGNGSSVAATVVTVATALAAALAVLLHRTHRRPDPVVAAAPTNEPASRIDVPDPQIAQMQGERHRMVREIAELVAALPPEFEWQAERVLTAAGVRPIDADGAEFDPRLHHAVGTEITPDAGLHDTVARTLRRGWVDGDRVVSPARVVVYVVSDRPGVLP